MQSRMKLLNAAAFVAFQFALMAPASAQEAQPGDACPVVGRYTLSGGPELSGITHQMVCNASNVWSGVLDNDAAGNVALVHAVSLTGDISPAQITANQNDYNPAGLSTASVLRVNSNASRNVTSLAGGTDGRIVTVMNIGSFPIVLKNDDGATGTAANRFALTGDLTLAAKQSAMLMYDSTASRWRQIANGTASGSGDNLGNHTATTNIQLGSNWLSGDGGSEGIRVDATGRVSLASTTAPNAPVQIGTAVAGSMTPSLLIGSAGAVIRPNILFVDTGNDTSMMGIDNSDYFAIASENSQAGIQFKVNGSAGGQYLDNATRIPLKITTAGVVDIANAMTISGSISGASTVLAANIDNWAPTGFATATVIRMTSSGNVNLTGIAGGADGRVITLMNTDTTDTITLKNDVTSTAANRFKLTGDLALAPNQSAMLMYDSTASRWRQIANGTAAGGTTAAAGSDREIQFNNAGALGGATGLTYTTGNTLDFWSTDTGTAATNVYRASFGATVQPASAQTSDRRTIGVAGRIDVPSGNTQQLRELRGVYGITSNSGSGPIDMMIGTMGYGWASGTANVTNLRGMYAGAEQAGSGTIAAMGGVDAESSKTGTGNVTDMMGLYTKVGNANATGTVTNGYGLFIDAPTLTGAITNQYGIYQAGSSSRNYLAGKLGIGVTVPDSELHVSGTDSNVTAKVVNNGSTASRYPAVQAINFNGGFNGYPMLQGIAYGGSSGTPTAVTSGKSLLSLEGLGATGLAYNVAYGGGLMVFATENWSTSANGANLIFYTTPNGGAAPAERVKIDQDGTLKIEAALGLTNDITPSQITANQNDYNPAGLSTASVLRVNSDASRTITGLAGGADGRVLTILNVGSNPIVLSNQDVSSTAANRFAFGINVTLAADQTAAVIYDDTSQRWRAAGVPFDTGTCGDSTSGFFVLTRDSWNGDLVTEAGGGMSGLDAGNALCLSDLTTYDWQCKSVAQNRGLLNSTHIKAFLCDSAGCNDATASTVYYFARSNDPSAGGNRFKTDASAGGPQESSYWDSYYNMNDTRNLWSGRNGGTQQSWPDTPNANTCTNWTSSSAGIFGRTGNTNNYDTKRWSNGSPACNATNRLVCFVNP